MPAHLIYGDSFLTSQELKSLGDGLDESALMGSNFHRLAGNRVTLPELLDICNALPFLDPVRFVLVEGLLSVYERGAGTGRGRGRRPAGGRRRAVGNGTRWRRPFRTCRKPLGWSFWTARCPGATRCCGACPALCEVHALEPPVREGLAVWIKNQAQEKGSGIAPAAVRLLARPGGKQPLVAGPGIGETLPLLRGAQHRRKRRPGDGGPGSGSEHLQRGGCDY